MTIAQFTAAYGLFEFTLGGVFGAAVVWAYSNGMIKKALYLITLFDELDERYTAMRHRCGLYVAELKELRGQLAKFTGPRDNLGRWMPRKAA